MRIKTIVIILITVLLTVVIMQNTGSMSLNILWMKPYVSKLWVMLIVAIIAFVLGYLVGRPKRQFNLGENSGDQGDTASHTGTLSEEDKDYIN